MRPVKWWKYKLGTDYNAAKTVAVFDTNGRAVDLKREDLFLDEAKVLRVSYKGNNYLEIVIKRPRITYEDIHCSRQGNGYYNFWCRVNGYYYDKSYLYYSKREA